MVFNSNILSTKKQIDFFKVLKMKPTTVKAFYYTSAKKCKPCHKSYSSKNKCHHRHRRQDSFLLNSGDTSLGLSLPNGFIATTDNKIWPSPGDWCSVTVQNWLYFGNGGVEERVL